MVGGHAIRTSAIGTAMLACAGLIVVTPTNLSFSSPPSVQLPAINLTAAEGVVPTAGDALDPSWLSQAFSEINTYTANFFNTASAAMADEVTSLNSIYSEWLNEFGADINSAIQNLGALGQAYGSWAEGWFQTVVDLETEMPGTITADNTTLCDVFTLIGMDMDKWANAVGMGLGDTFQNVVAEFTAFDQQMMDGLTAFVGEL